MEELEREFLSRFSCRRPPPPFPRTHALAHAPPPPTTIPFRPALSPRPPARRTMSRVSESGVRVAVRAQREKGRHPTLLSSSRPAVAPCPLSHQPPLSLSLTHSHALSLSLSHTHTHTQTPPLLAGLPSSPLPPPPWAAPWRRRRLRARRPPRTLRPPLPNPPSAASARARASRPATCAAGRASGAP